MDRDGFDKPDTDAQLLAAARDGDRHALETLWTRHESGVRGYARQIAKPSDVEELVSESFYRVLKAILDGAGPETAFRAYVLTTLRRAHVDLGRGYHQRVRLTGDDGELDATSAPSAAEVAGENAERSAAWRAWQSLPEDSRTLLRQLIIEERTPAELAPLLGTTANGVSSRGLRARERLRQAYLQQQLQAAETPDCGWARSRLGGYTRHALARREQLKVRQHLNGCPSCAAAAAELADLNSMLRTRIAPILLGGLLLARNLPGTATPKLVSATSRLGSSAHRLGGARVVLVTGSIAAAVLLVPLVIAPAQPHRQLILAPEIRPVGTSTGTLAVTTHTSAPHPASTSIAHPRTTARQTAVSAPSPINPSARTHLSTRQAPVAAPKPGSSRAIAASNSAPAAAPTPSRPAVTSPAPTPGTIAPDTRSSAGSPAAAPGVSRTVPFTVTIGGRRWVPGVLTATVPAGWTIGSLSSTGQVLPCRVESLTTASCQISGPANTSYCFQLEATGPADAGADDRFIATFSSGGVALLDLELPLT